jgi:hypothetical protein
MIANLKKLEPCESSAEDVVSPVDHHKAVENQKNEMKTGPAGHRMMSVPRDGWLSGAGHRMNFA